MVTYPLSLNELSSLYFQLQKFGAYARGDDTGCFNELSREEILAIAIESSRWDIRLLYIVIDFIANHFQEIRLFKLKSFVQKNPTPEVIGVIKEFSALRSHDDDLKLFFMVLIRDIKPQAQFKLFYVGGILNSETIEHESTHSLKEYKKWGFLCTEFPFLKESTSKKKLIHYSKEERIRILEELLHTKKQISLLDYLKAIQFSVTRQHARLDLLSHPSIVTKGQTKGTTYQLFQEQGMK